MTESRARRLSFRGLALWAPAGGFWLVLAAIATGAGVVRERWLVPQIGDLRGHQIGTLVVTAACALAIATFVARMRLTPREALATGAGWLVGAIAFEFGFGHYVDGLSWSRLLADYDLSRGRLLLLVWLTLGAGPFLLASRRQRRARR